MAYETISAAPTSRDFTPLSEHQEQTPGSFFTGKPVLHLHCPSAKIRILNAQLTSRPDFAALNDGHDAGDGDGEVVISSVDVWVTSRYALRLTSA